MKQDEPIQSSKHFNLDTNHGKTTSPSYRVEPKNKDDIHCRSTLSDKEVQTEFPAAMLEEYILEHRRRVLRLLRYPKNSLSHGGRNTFKDLFTSRVDEDSKKSSTPPYSNRYPNSFHNPKLVNTQTEICDNLSSSSECLASSFGTKKLSNHIPLCHQISQPSCPSPNILDSSALSQKHQNGLYKNLERFGHPYSHSFDNQDNDTYNFQSSLHKAPRNSELSGHKEEDEAVTYGDKKDKIVNNSKSNHARFSNEGSGAILKTRRPTSCLSLGRFYNVTVHNISIDVLLLSFSKN